MVGTTWNKPQKLDVARPSARQLHEAFVLAARLWDAAPWKGIVENQLLVMERADGRRKTVSVMGEAGTHRAIAIYQDPASYWRINGAPSGDRISIQDVFFSTFQLQFAFLKASELSPLEKAALKASGIKFPRGVNPALTSYVPGYAPEMMGAHELADAMEFLTLFMDFLEKHSPDEIRTAETQNDLISVWREAADGSWTLAEDEFSPLFPVFANLDVKKVDAVAKLPVNDNFMLEVGAIPVPVGSSKSGMRLMSRLLLVVDSGSEFLMGTDIIAPPEGMEFDWSPVVDRTLDIILKYKSRPVCMSVLGASLEGVFAGLCSSEFKGTRFIHHADCKAVRSVFKLIRSRIGL